MRSITEEKPVIFENHHLVYKCRKLKNLKKSIQPGSTTMSSTQSLQKMGESTKCFKS